MLIDDDLTYNVRSGYADRSMNNGESGYITWLLLNVY